MENNTSGPSIYQNHGIERSPKYGEDNQFTEKKENPDACIFIASLNKDVADRELHAGVYRLFKKWGPLLSVKVFKDWLKRPYAFVQFEFVEDCKKALRESPGSILNGRHIRCEPARVNRSICLISLNYPFNKKFIHNQLSVFGEIEDITILQPHGKFQSIFIKFKYREDAITAYLALKFTDRRDPNHKCPLLGSLNHQWFIEWSANLDTKNPYSGSNYRLEKSSIFVGNLPDYVEEEDLFDIFEKYGPIQNLEIIRKPCHAKKKVFAFIKFQDEQNATEAIEKENGVPFDDRLLRVCYRQHSEYTKHNSTVPFDNPRFLPIAPSCYSLEQDPQQLPVIPQVVSQQNREECISPVPMPPFVYCLPCYNSMLPMYEPYTPVPNGKLVNPMYPSSAETAPYYQYSDNQNSSSTPPQQLPLNENEVNPCVNVAPNTNCMNGYYMNTYPTMIYYNYSPYYQANTSLGKKSSR